MAPNPPVSPTMVKPKAGPDPNETLTQDDLDDLTNTLGEFNVKSKDDLTGRLQASNEVGQLTSLLGEIRNENALLRDEMSKLRSAPSVTQSQENDMFGAIDNMQSGQTIDFEGSVEKAVERAITKRDKAMADANRRRYQSLERARQHKMYDRVKPIIDKRVSEDPTLRMQLNAGAIDYYDLFRDTVEEFQTNLLVKSHETIQTLTTGNKPIASANSDANPPHIESGSPTPGSQNLVNTDPDNLPPGEAVLKKAQEKVEARGVHGGRLSSDEELDLIQATLGDLPL